MIKRVIFTLSLLYIGQLIYIIFYGFDPARDVGIMLGELGGVIAMAINFIIFKEE